MADDALSPVSSARFSVRERWLGLLLFALALVVMILALAAGVEPVRAAELSNVAAGIAVRKLGTATVSVEELNCALAD